MSLAALWYCIVAATIAMYVVLDGYDLGAGMVHLLVSRSESDRKQILDSIHPLWDGNEVWLIAAGTTLYFAFPTLFAVSFSGFYLPLTIVMWLLIFRGTSIEFRNHIDSPVWKPFWDSLFGWSSAALALFYGTALGNVVRGVPLDPSGHFFLPLWTDFRFRRDSIGVLDWYTASIGVAAALTILHHGALWVALQTTGRLEADSRRLAKKAWFSVLAVTLWISLLSFRVQPHLLIAFRERPWGLVFPLSGVLGLLGSAIWNTKAGISKAFISSSLFITGLLASAAFGLFPNVLPALGNPALSLTIYNATAPESGLKIGLLWFIPGILLAIGYSVYTHLKFTT